MKTYIANYMLDSFITHSLRCLPDEACGLLLGSKNDKGFNIVEMVLLRNVKPSPGYFEMDPDDVLATSLRAIDRGMEIVGTIHSHPYWPATPSETDVSFMKINGGIWVIASLNEGYINSFVLRDGNIVKVPL